MDDFCPTIFHGQSFPVSLTLYELVASQGVIDLQRNALFTGSSSLDYV